MTAARNIMASQLHEAGGEPSLSEELRAATRQKHHALNSHIIARLPLCMPPHTDSPLEYTKGMMVFGQIYFAFEEALALHQAFSNDRMRGVYERIQLFQLLRTKRLENDIALLKLRLLRSEVEELEYLDEESKVFSRRIRGSLAKRPHLMLAYTWTMYLALFNGGRWIRRQLVSGGGHFRRGEVLPLSFWDFGRAGHDNLDEDQLKDAFKTNFSEAASHLTDDERLDVVDETNKLFDLCSEMVEFLDQKSPSKSTSPKACLDTAPARSFTSTKVLTDTLWTCMTSAYTLSSTTPGTRRTDKIRSSG